MTGEEVVSYIEAQRNELRDFEEKLDQGGEPSPTLTYFDDILIDLRRMMRERREQREEKLRERRKD
jgi:hypothetical protein